MTSNQMELWLHDMMGKGDLDWILGGEGVIKDIKTKGDVEAKFNKAYAAFLAKKYEEAADLFEKLYQKFPEERAFLSGWILSVVNFDLGKAQELVSRFPKKEQEVVYHYLEGLLLEKKGDFERATLSYQTALDINDGFMPAIFRMAYYVSLHGEDDQAVKIYEKAMKNNPLYSHLLLNLGLLYEDYNQFYRAIECYKKVLRKYPRHPRAMLFLKDAEASLTMFVDEDKEREQDKQNQILSTPITDFELSVRSKNCLNKMKIRTLGDLIRKTEAELLSYKNFGETSLAEIKDILNKKGLKLGMGREDEETLRKRDKKATKPIKVPDNKEVLSIPVDKLELSVRSRKCLITLDIKVLGDLIQKTEKDLLNCKNFGNTSMMEIKQKLEEYGLALREEE